METWVAVVLLDNLLPSYQTGHYAVDCKNGKMYAMTDQGRFCISESASIYPQQGTTLLSNSKGNTNVLNMHPNAESIPVQSSVVSLRTSPMSGGF